MCASTLNTLDGLILGMSLADRIKEAMGTMSPADLARATKKTPGAVTQWLDGTTKSLKADTAAMLQAATGYSSSWLVTGKGEKLAAPTNVIDGPEPKGTYPLISEVIAGDWAELCDNFQPGDAEAWLPSTKNLGRCGYMLRVYGKSMENPGGRYSFPDGMILHVNPDLEPMPGQFVIVRRESTKEATFKRYVLIEGKPFLEAINPDWPRELKYLALHPGDVWCGVVVDASIGGLP